MRRIFEADRRIIESRFTWISAIFICVTAILWARVWFLQVYRGEYYRKIAENNRVQYLEIPAPRGLIYDRNGKPVLSNRPYSDLVFVPQFVTDIPKTFEVLGALLHQSPSSFEKRFEMSRGLPKYLPVVLKRNLTEHEIAAVLSNKIFLPGVDVAVAPRRDYLPDTPSHLVGYLSEINKKELEAQLKIDPKAPYRSGDLIGKQGLEARWEKYLRGIRGNRLIQVDAHGRQVDPADRTGINLPQENAIAGADLILTLDMELQRVAREAFRGKNGAVVVMNAQNGEILALLSEPGYDPTIYQTGMSVEKYRSLVQNPFKPFLDKTTGGVYMPGSTYKALVAIAALEEGIIDGEKTYFCPGHYTLGGQTFRCWEHSGHGTVNLRKALMKSCDTYFFNIGVDLGVDRMAKYAQLFGLGQKTGLGLNFEQPGLIPTTAWKKLTFRLPWSAGETPSVAIGQGAVGTTPIQLASLYATIANEGQIWRPFVVKKVVNSKGETILQQEPELIAKLDSIKPETYRLVKEGLKAVVMDPEGTGKNSAVDGVEIAGKTGSAQVVSLSKNSGKNQQDVSLTWREHALFTAFSPVDKPEIAVVIVSEHDKVAGGGRSAAPVAGKIFAAYYEFKKRRSGDIPAPSATIKPDTSGSRL